MSGDCSKDRSTEECFTMGYSPDENGVFPNVKSEPPSVPEEHLEEHSNLPVSSGQSTLGNTLGEHSNLPVSSGKSTLGNTFGEHSNLPGSSGQSTLGNTLGEHSNLPVSSGKSTMGNTLGEHSNLPGSSGQSTLGNTLGEHSNLPVSLGKSTLGNTLGEHSNLPGSSGQSTLGNTLGEHSNLPVSSGSRDEVMDLYEYKLYFVKELEKLTSRADRLFGQKFWSHSITKLEIDCVDYVDGCYSVAASAIVKISLKNGMYHEEHGCGFSFKLTNKAISISNAHQDAKLDAFRKAIISFGYSCEREEYMEINKNSWLKSRDYSMKRKKNTSFHSHTDDQSANESHSSSSPRNSCTNVSLPSPKGNNPVNSRSEQREHDIRAERKRKQELYEYQPEYELRTERKRRQQQLDAYLQQQLEAEYRTRMNKARQCIIPII